MPNYSTKDQARDQFGRFGIKDAPPLVNIQVNNPINYLKLWWNKIIANEGVDLRLRIKPLTAISFMVIIVIGSFGVGKLSMLSRTPIGKYIPLIAPTPAPDPWLDAGYAGVLRYMSDINKYFLETNDSKIISLTIPSDVNLTKYIGKRILVSGKYNSLTQTMIVVTAADFELLPATPSLVPTSVPTFIPIPS